MSIEMNKEQEPKLETDILTNSISKNYQSSYYP